MGSSAVSRSDVCNASFARLDRIHVPSWFPFKFKPFLNDSLLGLWDGIGVGDLFVD